MSRSTLRATVLAVVALIATAGVAAAQTQVTATDLASGSMVLVPVSASQSNLPAKPVSASQAGTPSISLNPLNPLGSPPIDSAATAAAVNAMNTTVMDLLTARTNKAARIRELRTLLAIATELERLNLPANQRTQLRQIESQLTARLALLLQQ
jgi:hypothetical protein